MTHLFDNMVMKINGKKTNLSDFIRDIFYCIQRPSVIYRVAIDLDEYNSVSRHPGIDADRISKFFKEKQISTGFKGTRSRAWRDDEIYGLHTIAQGDLSKMAEYSGLSKRNLLNRTNELKVKVDKKGFKDEKTKTSLSAYDPLYRSSNGKMIGCWVNFFA